MICQTELIHPRMKRENILVADMFRVLMRTIDAIGAIEEYLMQTKIRRTRDSTSAKELENVVEELGNKVVTVVHNTKLLKIHQERETELEQDEYNLQHSRTRFDRHS